MVLIDNPANVAVEKAVMELDLTENPLSVLICKMYESAEITGIQSAVNDVDVALINLNPPGAFEATVVVVPKSV